MLRISVQKHFIGVAFSYKMVFERIPGDMCSKTYNHITITKFIYFFTWGTLFYVTLDPPPGNARYVGYALDAS